MRMHLNFDQVFFSVCVCVTHVHAYAYNIYVFSSSRAIVKQYTYTTLVLNIAATRHPNDRMKSKIESKM